MVFYTAIKSHFDNDGTCEYDLCGSDYHYKMCWTDVVHKQYAFQAYNPFRFYSRLLLQVAKIRNAGENEKIWQP